MSETSAQSHNSNPWLRPLLWFLGITALTVAVGYLPISWEGWRVATCMPSHCFCEHLRNGTVRQPANTYSNLGFVLVGLLIISMIRRDNHTRSSGGTVSSNLINNTPTYTLVYGWAVVFVGLFSMFYHASMTFIGQWFDVMAMYLLATFILLYALARAHQWSGTRFVILYLISNSVLGWILATAPSIRRYVFGVVLVAGLVAEIYARVRQHPEIQTKYILWSAFSLILAFTIWILDLKGILCSSHSLIQGHAFWHLLCAVSSGLMYLYYRSEKAPLQPR